MNLPKLLSGEEGNIQFRFTVAGQKPGSYESVWHFWQGAVRFGPPLKLKIEIKPAMECIALIGTELKDYSATEGQEMRSIGISALAQEMIEMGDKKNSVEVFEDGFDLLAAEIDCNCEVKEDEDFEVIPIPDCFNLEVPFEVVEKEEYVVNDEDINNNEGEDEDEVEKVCESPKEADFLTEAVVAVRKVQEMLNQEKVANLTLEVLDEDVTVEKLVDMGFANRDQNVKLLRQNGQDLETVIKKLCSDNSGSWIEKRH